MTKLLSYSPLFVVVVLFFVLSLNFLPVLSFAAEPSYTPPPEGLVPCGKGDAGPMDCTFQKLIELIDNVLKFFMYAIVFPVAIMLIIYAGGRMVWFASTNPKESSKAKGILVNVIIGFFIVFAAYAVVEQILVYFIGDSAGADNPIKKAMEVVFPK